MGEYSKCAPNAFESILFNAGILVKNFDPTTGVASSMLGSTNSGFNFKDPKAMMDFGEDIDGCPKGVKELQREDVDARDIHGSGTFVTVDATQMKSLMAGADATTVGDVTKLTPREVTQADFEDVVWFISDYGKYNIGAGTAGYVAIKMQNVLNVSGLSIQSTDKAKGQFDFNYKAHRSMANVDKIPYEVWVKTGSATTQPGIVLDAHTITVAKDSTVTLTATTIPAGATVTWASSDSTKASVSSGVVTGEAAGTAIVSASITVDGITYNDTCTVVVTAST